MERENVSAVQQIPVGCDALLTASITSAFRKGLVGVEGGGAGGQICSMTAPWGSGLIGCTRRVVSSMSALP